MKNQNLGIRKRSVTGIGALVAMVLASGLALPVWAGRPLATEDAGVLGQGECEIESYAGRVRSNDSDRLTTRWAQFGCGIGHDSQLAFGAGADRADGETTTVAALTGKTFLRKLTDDQTGLVLAYTLHGAKNPGNSFRHDATEIKAVVSIPRNGWLLHANLGSQYSQTAKVYSTIWGLAVERPGAVGPVDLMAEVFGDDRTAPWVQVGARWTVVPERFYLDTSWGVQTDSARTKQITVGLKFAF
ncbi:MAG: hypothetical protein IH605_03820 [Burkholderiales bacterium]|nr:hypothetical protein [Burkholderiales bacterium]